jgi:hypothetical protein
MFRPMAKILWRDGVKKVPAYQQIAGTAGKLIGQVMVLL